MLNTDKIYFYPYKIFGVEGRKYLYTIYASGLFEIDNAVSKLLQLNDSTVESIKEALKIDLTEDKLIGLLTDMENEKLLYRNEVSHDESQEIEKANFSALTLMLAQECNMRCSYCYGEGGEYNNKGIMTENVAFQAIDYLVKNSTDELLHIAFLGGEPLLNFPLLKKVVEYCKQISADTGKKFSYTITTNGTLITDSIEKYLIENKIVCQISLDGTKEKNDMNRFFRNKKGSYDVIVEKTKSMRHMNLVTARATVTPDNSDYKEIFNHLNELEFRAIPIAIAQNMVDDEQFDKILSEYINYIFYFEELILTKQYAKAKKMTDLVNALEKIEFGNVRNNGCGAGRTMFAVDIDGTLYPCHRFVGERKFALGNIWTGSDNSKFLKMINVRNRDKCSKCWAQNLCLGCCPHENYTNTNNINLASERSCRMAKTIYEKLISVYIRMSDEDKKMMWPED